MFYSKDILQKRGGKFGKIWLAATRMCKLTRREIAAVCISKSCDEVLAYVEKRVPPSHPGEKRPRLSLYLSAQLMYGLSRILEKQSAFLLFDVCNTFIRVRMIPVHDINLLEVPREDLVTMPKVTRDTPLVIDTSLDEFLEVKPPEGNLRVREFSSRLSQHHQPSESASVHLFITCMCTLQGSTIGYWPYRYSPVIKYRASLWNDINTTSKSSTKADRLVLIQMMMMMCYAAAYCLDCDVGEVNGYFKEQFLGVSSSSDRSSTATRRSRDTDTSLAVADVTQITLVEPPPVVVDTPLSPIPIPRELDLPPMNGQELEMFLETVPEPRLSVEDLLPTSTPMHKEHDGRREATIASPILEEPKEKTPSKRTTTVDAVRTRAVPPSPGVTQQILTSPLARRLPTRASLQLELTPLIPSPARQRQRKHPVFADKETQIPKQDLKQNLLTSSDTRKRFELKDPRAEGPEALFNRPSRKGHRPEVLTGLWAMTAKFRSGIPEDQLPAIESPSESSLSEEARGIEKESTMRQQLLLGEESFMDLDRVQLDTDVTMVDAQLQTSLQVPEPELRASSPIPLVTPTEDFGKRRRRKRTLEESVERLRKTGSATDLHGSRIGTPSIERLRDTSTSRLAGSLDLDETLILDDSRKSRADKSSSKKKPRLSEPDLDEVHAVSVAASHTPSASTLLYDLPEESVISDQSLAIITPADLENEDLFLEKITETIHSQDSNTTTFSAVCPPAETDRKKAAWFFMALLNLLKKRRIKVEQRESFGEIYISLQE